jgi:APA family basic amino acid/polyamine antiporter
VWASVLTLTNSYSGLLTYTAFASLLFNSMAVAGIFVLRKNAPNLERPYKVWGYPVIPILFILISVFFIIFIVQGDPRNSLFGLGLIVLGIPVYYYFVKKHRNVTSIIRRDY